MAPIAGASAAYRGRARPRAPTPERRLETAQGPTNCRSGDGMAGVAGGRRGDGADIRVVREPGAHSRSPRETTWAAAPTTTAATAWLRVPSASSPPLAAAERPSGGIAVAQGQCRSEVRQDARWRRSWAAIQCKLGFVDRRKKLVNTHEAATMRLLEVSAGRNNARVYAKVRIADTLDMDRSGISNDLYSYGLKAHFDFVVADDADMPLFAVEYDGPTHFDARTVERDRMKNELCERLGLPLARVRDEHIFKQVRGIDYLTWLSEFYFGFQSLLRAQEEGTFPADELPDPMLFFSHPYLPGRFPLFISAHARTSLIRLHSKKLTREDIPMVLRGDDQAGRTNVLLLLQLADGSMVSSASSIYLHWFGICPGEAAEEIAIVNLESLVKEHVEAQRSGLSSRDWRFG